MPFTMIRRPRAARRMTKDIRKEIRQSYNALGQIAIGVLKEDVTDWEDKPEFKVKVTVSKKRWVMTLTYDRRTRGGKKYTWVNEGTGSYNPNTSTDEYEIKPKRPGGSLKYNLPSLTKTMPASGVPSRSSQAAPAVVITGGVIHPGIDPRHFTKDLFDHLKSKKSGSFRNVTEAAIKRAFRRIGIHT